MIEAGEPLGTRYVVVKTVPELHVGMLIEVADHAGMQFSGQLLHASAAVPALAAEVRQAVVALPALAGLLRPRDVALTSTALPVALLERPGGASPAAARLGEVVEALGRREATVWLFRQIAAVANDLAQVHQLGAFHGAISAASVVCAAFGDVGNLQLAGFGIEAFARSDDPAKAPTRRSDLVALLNSLHELFGAGGLSPEGGAAGKWLLLRTSAQHGEHPALASGAALAAALTEMASLRPDDAPPRPVRAPTLAPPTRSSVAGRKSSAPSGARRTDSPTRRSEQGTASSKAPPPREESDPPPRRSRIRFAVVVPAILLICAGVTGAVWYALHAGDDIGVGNLVLPRHTPRVGATAACAGEDLARPEGISDFQAPGEFDAVCLPSPDRLALIARKGTTVQIVSRPARRGQHFGDPQSVATGAVELGSSLLRDAALWVAWRNGVGAPFGLARVDGDRVATVPVPLPGWDSVPLRGAWLLDVSARGAWLVTSVLTEGGEHVVLLQITFGPAAPDVVAWLVGAGFVHAVIAGETPSVLIDRRLPGDAPRHEVTDVTLNLHAIAAARHPSDATAVRGAAMPEAGVTRSPAVVLEGAVIGPARRGATVNGAHAWLVARGGAQPQESCQVPDRCHTAGPVTVLAFGADAPPTVTLVEAQGWAVDLVPGAGGGLSVLATTANVAGSAVPFHTLFTLATPRTAPTVERPNITTSRSPRARIVPCGTEAWVAFDATLPSPMLTALPVTCLRAQ